ncbi:hypothetical protein PIB30_060130 [Stylosanthes scabra]|uniref:Uncharacterized protein n=1 Tax=Stylosanthes scabra TaxID=79078 RepID=A0ABU6YIP1_9FABA|nr:hypothetical protein [Stylosanthes scabra]
MPRQNKCGDRTDTEPVNGPSEPNSGDIGNRDNTKVEELTLMNLLKKYIPMMTVTRRRRRILVAPLARAKVCRRRFGGRHWQASSDGCAEAGAQRRGRAEAAAEKNEVQLRRPEKKDSRGLPALQENTLLATLLKRTNKRPRFWSYGTL